VAGRLDEIAAQLDGGLVVACAACANAVAARCSQALRNVSHAFEGLGAFLYAAEASVESAAVRRRGGPPRDADADDHRAGHLLSRCEGATTPAVGTFTARARLTPGEIDTAVDAASGRTNKQIAADSHISARTVVPHLLRVFGKLGISTAANCLMHCVTNRATEPASGSTPCMFKKIGPVRGGLGAV